MFDESKLKVLNVQKFIQDTSYERKKFKISISETVHHLYEWGKHPTIFFVDNYDKQCSKDMSKTKLKIKPMQSFDMWSKGNKRGGDCSNKGT